MSAAPDRAVAALPPPFDREHFTLVQRGVFDSNETEVYWNEAADFAFLHPRPAVDYVSYKPRVATLELADYKKSLSVVARRHEKIANRFGDGGSVLEVGAADGAFLAHLHERHPGLELASLEVDRQTRPARDALAALHQYGSFEELEAAGRRFDRVCMFHVLEHIPEPLAFLASCARCLAPGGWILIEVPSLDDPLLSLYDCDAYRRFYFQRQHPYVYSARSLGRLLERAGLVVEETIHHQRYGLENHLHWLSAGKPGGSERLREILGGCDASYRRALEQAGHADAVIAVARPAR